MSDAPVVTCGVTDEDRAAIVAQCDAYARALVHAPDVSAAEAACAAAEPAVVMLHVGGTDADAYDVCRAWKATYPDVPVVVIAPDDEMDTKLEAVSAGADQFLVSPIDDEALAFVLRFFLVEKGR